MPWCVPLKKALVWSTAAAAAAAGVLRSSHGPYRGLASQARSLLSFLRVTTNGAVCVMRTLRSRGVGILEQQVSVCYIDVMCTCVVTPLTNSRLVLSTLSHTW